MGSAPMHILLTYPFHFGSYVHVLNTPKQNYRSILCAAPQRDRKDGILQQQIDRSTRRRLWRRLNGRL